VAANQSKPFLNFGPVSRDGGERRLNVLASRAREKCVVFSSITAADIPPDHELKGTRMLRSLLHFAETGNLAAGTLTGGGFDSPFEEAVASVIREAGFEVHSQVGVSSFRVDLGVIDRARPGSYVLGVECDGAAYHSSRSARDRDRLRQEVLEGLGWRLHRVWSTDWFRNPIRETSKLIAAIQAAIQRESSPTLPIDMPIQPSASQLAEVATVDVAVQPKEAQRTSAAANAYDEVGLTVPIKRDLLDLNISEVGRLAMQVVEAEGPIHTEEVARRIREAFGLQKTGRLILEHVKGALSALARQSTISREGEFWDISGRSVAQIRDRRNVALPLRKVSNIAPSEIGLALKMALDEAVAISREDLVVQAARLFGFDRTGPDLKIVFEQTLNKMITDSVIEDEGDRLIAKKRV
jgi:very-short-patch-repair endonuclease